MTTKIKIALHSIMQKVSRGIFTQEQAAAHFKIVTGQDLEEFASQGDTEVGEFLAFLESAYPEPPAQDLEAEADQEPEAETEPAASDAPAVPVVQEKRTRTAAKPKLTT